MKDKTCIEPNFRFHIFKLSTNPFLSYFEAFKYAISYLHKFTRILIINFAKVNIHWIKLKTEFIFDWSYK